MFTIGAASRLSGVHVETIRYYEREGLIPAPQRSAAGHRYFDDEAVATLKFIAHCRAARFSIRDIRSLLALRSQTDISCADGRRIGLSHVQALRDAIDSLTRLEEGLTQALENCDPTRSDCAMIRELERDKVGPFRSGGPVSPF